MLRESRVDCQSGIVETFGRKKILQGSTKKAEEEYDKRVEGLLSRMNIPTKGEIESLSEKIADLGEKVDELNRKRQ